MWRLHFSFLIPRRLPFESFPTVNFWTNVVDALKLWPQALLKVIQGFFALIHPLEAFSRYPSFPGLLRIHVDSGRKLFCTGDASSAFSKFESGPTKAHGIPLSVSLSVHAVSGIQNLDEHGTQKEAFRLFPAS